MPADERPRAADPPAPAPSAGLVPVRPHGSIELAGAHSGVLLDANRQVTFGFLLGYLSLAVHGTLQYPRFAQYYVGPWVEPAEPPELDEVQYWSKAVARRIAYSSEIQLGQVLAVVSDGPVEPRWIYSRFGGGELTGDPPPRIAVRSRLPRVDLVLRPEPGHSFDLHDFAREIGERFTRMLD